MSRFVKLLCFLPLIISFTVTASDADTYLENIKTYLAKHDADLMEKEAYRLFSYSEGSKDDTSKLEALKFLGIAKHLQSNYDSAIVWYNQALELCVELNDSVNIGKTYLNLATSFNARGDFETAVKNALLALGYFELMDDKNGQGRVQNLLGIFHFNREDYKGALAYFEKYNRLAIESKDTGEIVSSMNNLSSTYHVLNEYKKERLLIEHSIAIQEEQGQHIRIGSAYENLGTLYLDTDSLQLAEHYFLKAQKAYEINGNTFNLARLFINFGLINEKRKEFRNAEINYKTALDYAVDGGFLKLEEKALHKLAMLHEEQANYKKAYKFYVQYVEVKDSLLNEKNQASINELMIEFDTEKKERQITVQELALAQKEIEIKRKSFVIGGLSAVIIILLLFSFIVYSRIKVKQERRLNTERLQMKQVQMKVVLDSQESERKRFARDLHDGFGQLITALKIMLGQMHQSNEKAERSELALKSTEVLDTMHSELREIAHNLMPDLLIREGFVMALRDYSKRISIHADIEIELNVFGIEKRLNQAIEINLYRIIQEWINNVIKYSGAKKLSIQLTGYENEINILIEDNGIGFEKQKLFESKGWGWKNIQSRIEAINGILDLDTQPGSSGTSFIIDLPIA